MSNNHHNTATKNFEIKIYCSTFVLNLLSDDHAVVEEEETRTQSVWNSRHNNPNLQMSRIKTADCRLHNPILDFGADDENFTEYKIAWSGINLSLMARRENYHIGHEIKMQPHCGPPSRSPSTTRKHTSPRRSSRVPSILLILAGDVGGAAWKAIAASRRSPGPSQNFQKITRWPSRNSTSLQCLLCVYKREIHRLWQIWQWFGQKRWSLGNNTSCIQFESLLWTSQRRAPTQR